MTKVFVEQPRLHRVCLIFPKGGLEGNQTVLIGAAPKDSLITQGTSRGKYSRQPYGCSTVCQNLGFINQRGCS